MNSTLLFRLRVWSRLVLVLLGLGAVHPALAAHLLGGEMTYRYLDANGPAIAPLRYELTVTLYNNCGTSTTLRPSASVGIYDQATNARLELTPDNYPSTLTYAGQDGMMSIPQTTVSACLTPAIPPGCTITGPSLPYRVQKFVGVVNLPRSARGYYALFTDGNRNNDVTNLSVPGSQALTLYVALQPPQLPNHSPVFSDVAVAVICANDTTILLNNAVDADGDRLVYTFGQPYGIVGVLGTLPLSGFAPPPRLLEYTPGSGYSAATPFGTTAGNYAALDPATGIAKYLADRPGSKYVVAVDVNEYRTVNGQEILVGTTRRDLQLVVAQCPDTKAPVLPPPAVLIRNYTIEAGSSLSIPLTVTQADGHPLTLTLNSQLLDGAGGYAATLNGNPGTVAPGNPTGTATITGPSGIVTGTFDFATTCADARPTPYDVALTVKDTGCAGKTVAEVFHITVTKPLVPTAISGDPVVCDLAATYGYAARGGIPARLSWRVVGGTFVGGSTGAAVQVKWGSAGGTLTVRSTTQYGCPADSVTQRVAVGTPPTLAVAGSLTICQGSSATLAVTGGATYAVVGGPAPLTGPGPFAVSPTQTTTYTITALATSTNCAATTQVTVTVLPPPAANAGLGGRSTCSGVPISIGAAPVAGSTYSWSPATGLSSPTAANPTATLANTTGAPIAQAYTLTETNASGCQASHSVTLTVSPTIVPAVGTTTAICSGDVGQLGAAPVAGYTYSWSPATGLSSSTVANPTLTLPNTAGVPTTHTYTLTATDTSTGCSGSALVTVTVSPQPLVVPGLSVTICSGSTAQLGAAPVPGFSYSWSPATGLSNSTIANPTVTLTNTTGAAIVQTYTLTTTNPADCAASATVTVRVNPLPVAASAALATCSGNAAQLGAAPVASYQYSWSPATGLSSSTVANPTVLLTNTTGAPITQVYTLVVRNPATACISTATVAVTVNPAVGPGTIGPDQALCPGTRAAPLTSVAEVSGGDGTYAYQWEASADNKTWAALAGATSATYAPGTVAATTYYRRRVTSGDCAVATSNVVAVQLQPVLTMSVALATPPTQCAGLPFVFTPVTTNAGPAPTYRWFVNNILVASSPTYTATTLRNGDQVRVVLTPTAGTCTTGPAETSVAISLTPAPLPTLAISLQTALPVCPSTPITFQVDKLTDPGANPLYQWQVNGVAVPGAQGPVFTTTTLRNGQAVTLAVRTTTACGPITVISNALPVSLIEVLDVQAGPDKTIMEGDHVTLEGTANGTFAVAWTPAASLSFGGTSRLRPIASPAATTTYTLSAGSGYCTVSSLVTVTVTPRLRIPNALSPNGDGLNDTWEIDHIGDYPTNKVTVINRWGSKIFETTGYRRGNEWNGTIGGQPAPVGTYYYLISLGNGKSYTGSLTVVY